MRRVAVTGLGAVTPLGNDVASTWRAATAGESGIDWIRSFDPGDAPVRIAAEVKDFDASQERFDYLAASDQAIVQVMMSGSDCGLSGVKCCCATIKTEGRSDRRRDPHASGRLMV